MSDQCMDPSGCDRLATELLWFIGCYEECPGHPMCAEHSETADEVTYREPLP